MGLQCPQKEKKCDLMFCDSKQEQKGQTEYGAADGWAGSCRHLKRFET